jgi:hypothetical protein
MRRTGSRPPQNLRALGEGHNADQKDYPLQKCFRSRDQYTGSSRALGDLVDTFSTVRSSRIFPSGGPFLKWYDCTIPRPLRRKGFGADKNRFFRGETPRRWILRRSRPRYRKKLNCLLVQSFHENSHNNSRRENYAHQNEKIDAPHCLVHDSIRSSLIRTSTKPLGEHVRILRSEKMIGRVGIPEIETI